MKSVKITDKYELFEDGTIMSSLTTHITGIKKLVQTDKTDKGPCYYLIIDGEVQKHLIKDLVYEHFIGPVPPDQEVICCDCDTNNYAIDNLELSLSPIRSYGSKFHPDVIRTARQKLSQGALVKEVAAEFNMSLGTAYNLRNGTTWSHLDVKKQVTSNTVEIDDDLFGNDI